MSLLRRDRSVRAELIRDRVAEIRRLKRHLSNVVFRQLIADLGASEPRLRATLIQTSNQPVIPRPRIQDR